MIFNTSRSCFLAKSVFKQLRESKFCVGASTFVHDQKGAAALEFAFVVPVLLVFMLGGIGLFDGFKGARSFESGAATIVDIVTRQSEMDDDQIELMIATSKALIGSYADSSDFTISITSVKNEFDSVDDPTLSVGWSKANIASAEVIDEDLVGFNIPTIPEGNSVILIVTSASYSPYVTTDKVGIINYYKSVIRRPRFVDNIEYVE
jgi:Flp pilus assembly protein TadG